MSKAQHSPPHSHPHPRSSDEHCLSLPSFERVKYFFGQLLGVREFQSEQSYFFEKHRLHNRYLHGYGVICGLQVEPCRTPRDPCAAPDAPDRGAAAHAPDTEAATTALVVQSHPGRPLEMPERLCVEIDGGLALDCQGDEIMIPHPVQIDLIAALGCDARRKLLEGHHAHVSVCYVARPVEPVRPVTSDHCTGMVAECVASRLRDDFCVRVTWQPPPHDASCSPCQRPCSDPGLALARVAWSAEHGLMIDNGVRRTISLYVTTKIDGISWAHGGVYRAKDVDHMLRTGLTIRFSGPVHTSTLRRGVIDVWVIQGGGGRRGDIYSVPVEVAPSEPDCEFSHAVTVHTHAHRGDRIDPGDRVVVVLRSAFVLDRCCRAIDGEHIGGLVPQLADCAERWPDLQPPVQPPCRAPEPRPFARGASGNGIPGGNFESWFYVADDEQGRGE